MLIKMKYFALFALAAVGLAFTSQAAFDLSQFVPEGLDPAPTLDEKGECSYSYTDANGDVNYVTIFASVGEHSFTVIPGISKIDYLVVAGGGSGGSCQKKASGGGGAGGMLTGVWSVDDRDELKIKVGAGAKVPTNSQLPGNDGGNSFISNLVNQVGILTIGGGGGGYDKYTRNDKGEHTTTGGKSGWAPGFLGGSGGGAGGSGIQTASSGGACEEGQGNMGGSTLSIGSNRGGAGGGGAGSPGKNSGNGANLPGNGGDGVVCDITGRKVGYAAGGGGGIAHSGTTPALGGSVVIVDGEDPTIIGGNGATTGAVAGDGLDGTGSGGGGGSNYKQGGNGGSGIVILRYQVKDPRTLTVTPNEGYQVSLDGESFSDSIRIDKYPESEITITAKKSDDGTATYEWSGYPEGAVIDMNTITFTMPDNDVAITVTGSSAAAAKLIASVSPAEAGSITADPDADDGNYAIGTPVELTATPSAHYYFSGWTVDGESAGEANTLQLTMDADKTVVANFVAIPQKTLSVLAEGPGNVGGTEAGEYDEGTSVTLTATADTDCDFMGWTTNGVQAGSEAELSFELWSDVEVVATFQAKPRYGVTVAESDFGSVTTQTTAVKDEEGKYAEGSELKFTPKPKSGLSFAGWIVNGEPAGAENPLTVTLEGNLSVQAVFGYKLTMNILGGGTVQGASNGQVIEANTAVTLTAVPNEGGAFLNWAGDVSGTGTSVEFTMDGEKSITAYFKDGTTGRSYFDGGWSNTVLNAKGGTEYVIAFTKVDEEHTFKVPKGVDALSYLVVAGGGSGASKVNNGGGGGAGGVLTNTAPYAVSAGDVLSITVGKGGIAPTSAGSGVNGGNSSLTNLTDKTATISIVAIGGGGGGAKLSPDGLHGGSGGGAYGGGDAGPYEGGTGEDGQGFPGGRHGWAKVSGGGGGGAGGKGADGGSNNAATSVGGIGIESSISGISEYYAGGGGGGCGNNASNGGSAGGSGVGGQGGGNYTAVINGQPGLDGFGGGGGGSGTDSGIGGNGGSGVVILRYKVKGGMVFMIY